MRWRAWVGLLFTLCCNSESQSASNAATEASSPNGPATAGAEQTDSATTAAQSRYVLGDYVEYEYAGSYSVRPTLLRERVTLVDGLQLEIEVTAKRGTEHRSWIQVVTDTEANRTRNIVAELYEVIDGQRVRLENRSNADLMRLYSWTLPDCGPPRESGGEHEELDRHRERDIPLGAEAQSCRCARQRVRCDDRPATMETCECPDFLWGHGFGEVVIDGESTPYWRVRVRDAGRTQSGEPAARQPQTRVDLLHGTEAQQCALLFGSALGAQPPLTNPPQDLWDPDGPSDCHDYPLRRIRRCGGRDASNYCQRGRAGQSQIVFDLLWPRELSESGHDVPVVVQVSRPPRGFCDVLPRPLLMLHPPEVRDLDGDGNAELLWPNELILRESSDDGDLAHEFVVMHPYALVDGELRLQPRLGAELYENAARELTSESETDCAPRHEAQCNRRAGGFGATSRPRCRQAAQCTGQETVSVSRGRWTSRAD